MAVDGDGSVEGVDIVVGLVAGDDAVEGGELIDGLEVGGHFESLQGGY